MARRHPSPAPGHPSAAPGHRLAAIAGSASALAPLAVTGNALRPVATDGGLANLAFASGWHVSELPMLTLAAQLAVTGRTLARGGWRSGEGRLRLAAQAFSAAGLIALQRSALDSERVLQEALADGLGEGYAALAEEAGVSPADTSTVKRWAVLPPWLDRRSRLREAGLAYGPAGARNQLDIWADESVRPGDRAPVLVQVPGGAWVSGDSRHQAYPLMDRLRMGGWVCVPISYRLSPRATWPDHIVDVKRALAWVKAHISEYGGDPEFIVITGGSAGGHLSSLAALTANRPEFQPGFEDAETSVAAAVCMYGVYDLLDWDGHGGTKNGITHLERKVLKSSPVGSREAWRMASPIHRVGPHAPPMMLVHGTNDSLVPVDGARRMAGALKASSSQPVVYAELPYTQHAFDMYGSLRTLYTVRAVERFLAYVRARRTLAPLVDSTSG